MTASLPSVGTGGESDSWRASRQLPMYKDKPYGVDAYGTGRRRASKKSVLLGVLFSLLLFVVYRTGSAAGSDSSAGYFSWLSSEPPVSPESWPDRQQAVKRAFQTSWKGYRKYAWGLDVYHPVTHTGENMGPKPLGWFIVDSLDTMHLMGLESELKEARRWVDEVLDYDMDYAVNTFETTIRMLGGLLSAYYLSEDDMYLNKAVDLGDRLLGAFDSRSGVPYASVNLHTGVGKKSHADMGASSTAEAATLQLEFKYLANLTGEALYWEKAEKVIKIMEANHPADGLVPIYIQPEGGQFQGGVIRLGSRGDSYYEYLIKQYLQTNQQEPVYAEMYDEAVAGIKKHLVQKSYPNQLTFIGELTGGVRGKVYPKMDHLVCFSGGMFALGATGGMLLDEARREPGWSTKQEDDFQLGMEITRTCYETYRLTQTGLGPEIVYYNTGADKTEDFVIRPADAHNLQRPETVESLFVLWRLTKNPIYREWGWKIFESFEKWSKVKDDAGYTSLDDVRSTPPRLRDNMESFWLSETLKYLYLLFDDSEQELLPLTNVVFNTEAHAFPKIPLGDHFKTGWARVPVPAADDSATAATINGVAQVVN